MRNKLIKISAAIAVAFAGTSALAINNLQAYNVNPATVSVSGLSSGGFMAVQLGVAYSGTFQTGFGVFAGGPFDCTRNQGYTSCMYNATPAITTPEANMTSWSGSQIDSLSNLATRKFYGWYGGQDYTVGANPMNQLKTQMQAKGITTANTSWNTTSSAGHTFPTNYAGSGDNSCGSTSSPYVSNCGYDGAGAVLQWMYGTLNAPASSLGGTLIQFNQSEFIGSGNGMDTAAYLYVPASCATGSCKLHVSLHGCVQSHNNIGMSYINNTYYNNWADTNGIIILWPQALPDNTSHSTTDNGSMANGNGCWDWLGWYGNTFDQKGGTQLSAIVNMVNRITSGYSATAPGTPTGLAVGAVTNTTVALSWTATSGASSYTVYRGGVSVGTPTTNAFTDTGLTANTAYSYTVSATNVKGTSSQSTSVNATTTNATVPAQVTGLTNGTVTATSIPLSWTAVSGATNYDVYRNGNAIGNSTTTSYTDSGVSAGNSYTYNVAAANANGVGAQSANLIVTTPATGYSTTATNTVANLYVAGDLTLAQYLSLGAEYGYTATITLYKCGTTWTNQSNCGPMQ